MTAMLVELGLSQKVVALCHATDDVIFAAQALRAARLARSFTIVGELLRLDRAVALWESRLAECQLDSDTNGFDRSERWEGGESYSNAQSHQPACERRASLEASEDGNEAPPAQCRRPVRQP